MHDIVSYIVLYFLSVITQYASIYSIPHDSTRYHMITHQTHDKGMCSHFPGPRKGSEAMYRIYANKTVLISKSLPYRNGIIEIPGNEFVSLDWMDRCNR